MPRFQFPALFASATALALVIAPAQAQQTGQTSGQQTAAPSTQQSGSQSMPAAGQDSGQDASQSGEQAPMSAEQLVTLVEEHLALARTAVDEDRADDARQALQEAADEIERSMETQDQPMQAWQDLEDRLQEAQDALATDDMQAVRDALDGAESALAEAGGETGSAPAAASAGTAAGAAAGQLSAGSSSVGASGQSSGAASQTGGQGQQASAGSDAEPQAGGAPGRQPVPALDAVEAQVNGNRQDGSTGGQAQAGSDAQTGAQTGQAQAGSDAQVMVQAGQGQSGDQGGSGSQQAGTSGGASQETQDAGQDQQADQQDAEGEQLDVVVRESTEGTPSDPAAVQGGAGETVTVIEGETVAPGEAQVQQDGTPAAVEAEVVRGDNVSVEETAAILGADGQPLAPPAEMLNVAPTEIEGRDVVTFEGDSIGEVDSVVVSGGEVTAIIAHGGFLGIGRDRVAIPVSRLGVRGEEIVLLGLTEEQLDAMPEFDVETGQAVPEGQTLEVGRYE